MRIVQYIDDKGNKRIGKVTEPRIEMVNSVTSTYDLFTYAQDRKISMPEAVDKLVSDTSEDYETLLNNKRILIPVDHHDPYHLWITGTGLTHLGSAASRDQMHNNNDEESKENLTDSIKIFRAGVLDGKMQNGKPGVQPEWFYKGNGLTVIPPGGNLPRFNFAMDGGEEPEIAGVYVIDKRGEPVRLGFVLGNEFSDHKMEKINYLYLAHSKLRYCSYGPELLLSDLPGDIKGISRIVRNGNVVWEKEFLTGEKNMSHNIANLEYHHFKYPMFRQPGDLHLHFFGTSVLSFTDGIETEEGDLFHMETAVTGRPLVNGLTKS